MENNNEILFISSYPPRECGIGTYSKDLVNAIYSKFCSSISISICAIDESPEERSYPENVKYTLSPKKIEDFRVLANKINNNKAIKKVFVQHEFGLFGGSYGEGLLYLLYSLEKPVSVTFHTVLPNPDEKRKKVVRSITTIAENIVVMTKRSSHILEKEYEISEEKIKIIPHGTHITEWNDKVIVKDQNGLSDRLILSTFGLISSNKSIETALYALPAIVKEFPNILYLVLGKTHPEVIRNEGEQYRNKLEKIVTERGLNEHVRFVNKYLDLSELLEYLRMTDIYLFTSKDPHQAVSGTFVYAASAGCPIISTPIPQAQEMKEDNMLLTFDFQRPEQLSSKVLELLYDEDRRMEMGRNAYHKTRSTAWENTSVAHANLFMPYLHSTRNHESKSKLTYTLPKIELDHLIKMTNDIGIIQFSKFSEPDISSGYTLDDNARALIVACKHYTQTRSTIDLELIRTYTNIIDYMQQPKGDFLNYLDMFGNCHVQNKYVNLEDSNGRAIWALGVLIDHSEYLPKELVSRAYQIVRKALEVVSEFRSPRAMAFIIKGVCYCYRKDNDDKLKLLINKLAWRLLERYVNVSDKHWKWFENYLTYANSTLPEALLNAYVITKKDEYKMIAHLSFEFLLSKLFINGQIKVISNRGWLKKDTQSEQFGEQPIDVAYTIETLDLFYDYFQDERYREKMEIAFSWFLGNNHLQQTIYDPLTKGCCDGLEEHNVNLNQGAESTICYLMARFTMEKLKKGETEKQSNNAMVEKESVLIQRQKMKTTKKALGVS